jgi:hypothetical protein
MDPVTTALIAAVYARATSEVAKEAIVNSYEELKTLLKKKLGAESDVVVAIDRLESRPDSDGRRQLVAEEMSAARVSTDEELVRAATALLEQIGSQPRGTIAVQTAQGSNIAQGGTTIEPIGPWPRK